jgi:hypothetical protein
VFETKVLVWEDLNINALLVVKDRLNLFIKLIGVYFILGVF